MDPTYTEQYEAFELRHWWFVARREIIESTLDRFAEPTPRPSLQWLDIGCGTGVLLDSYAAITEKAGVEMDSACVDRARAKGLNVRRIAPTWDFAADASYDLVTLTDVIEHVEHETDAVNAVYRILRPGGMLLVTVPALMSLWSSHDVVNHHYRRYTRATLMKLFPPGRWEVRRCTYFSSLLLPMIWAARKWKGLRQGHAPPSEGAHDFKFGRLDPFLLAIFRLERRWLKRRNFPLGSSLLVVAFKR